MQIARVIKAGLKYVFLPQYRFLINAGFGMYNDMPDEMYLKRKYQAYIGEELHLEHPQTFNEKLQWLKLHDRKPEYSMMVDKYEVKKLIADSLGDEYVIPTLGLWERFDDIDFSQLPNQFVLKCTHDCGSVIICRDKTKFDKIAARRKIERSQKRNYYFHCREYPYKNVKPRIIAEKYMQDKDHKDLPVYKVFNFSGEPRIIQVIQNDKTKEETVDYFDVNWNLLDMRQNYPNSRFSVSKPAKLGEMLEISRKLSIGFPFIRTDLYVINGEIYFSEYTFYSDAGFAKFDPEEWDSTLGEWIHI